MKQENNYQGPLARLNVVDFGHYYAGPMVGMLLADQGANVIRIVRPGEPELPSQQYRLLNRNKKLLTLDLKTEEGKTQALSLIEKADVVIENFRPGVMKRLGLDYASVKDKNAGLVYLSLPGFASTDKERAQLQAWEGILSAATGIYNCYSNIRERLNFPPCYTSLAHCSMYGAGHGVTAIMAALLAREEHGFGTVLEVPLVDAGFSGCTYMFIMKSFNVSITADDPGRRRDKLQPFMYSSQDSQGVQEEKLGKAFRAMMPFLCKSYYSSDGRKFEFWGGGGPQSRYINVLFKTLGIYEQIMREGFVSGGTWETGLDNNIDAPHLLNPERAQRLEQLMQEAFLTKTADEWEELLGNLNTNKVRTREEFMAIAPLLESGVLVKLDSGQSELTVPGRLGDVSGPGNTLIDGYQEATTIDFETASELFSGHARKTSSGEFPSQPKGELLQNLKVLDLANIMAVPMSGYILAQYGAQVITSSSMDVGSHLIRAVLEANMGKRSILTDVTTAPGREIMQRLIGWSDVVVHNILDHTAKRMGVTHAELQAINPEVVSCQASAWGGTYRGGWERRPGCDMTIQAETGMQERYSGMEWSQSFGNGATVDVISALATAYTTLLAVWQKKTTGYSGEARTSLVRGCSYIQLPWMIAENGACDWGEAKGQDAMGEHWWQRIYTCQEGWIYVGTSEDRASDIAEVVLGKSNCGGEEQALEAAFAGQDCSFWLQKLDSANIACHRVLSIADHFKHSIPVNNQESNETVQGALEMLCWKDHPCGSPVTLPAPTWVRVGEARSYLRCTPAPRWGQHTKEILRELGYTDHEIEELIDVKVSHEYLPPLGSVDAYISREVKKQ